MSRATLLSLWLLPCAHALDAQQRELPKAAAAPTAAFITRLGNDTTAVERFARTGDTVNVEQVLRSPRTSLRHTHVQLAPGDSIASVHLMHHAIGAPVDAPLLASTKLTITGGDSAIVEVRRGDSVQTRTVSARADMIPSLPQSWLPYELAVERLRAAGGDSVEVRFLEASGDSMPVAVKRAGGDSVLFVLPFLTYRAQVDREGRILRLYVPRGTSVQRVPNVDVNRIAARWVALDRRGRAMGPLSPLDSVSTSIGGANVKVSYSRPRARGRPVWGNLVPWDTVWRTGANAATVFTTSRDLIFGSTTVPAGTYTLFTLPSRTGTTLILNKETTRDGEPLAGTDYDAKHDLARIPMTTARPPAHVEQFTITVEPRGPNGGALTLAWAGRRMSAPFRVK